MTLIFFFFSQPLFEGQIFQVNDKIVSFWTKRLIKYSFFAIWVKWPFKKKNTIPTPVLSITTEEFFLKKGQHEGSSNKNRQFQHFEISVGQLLQRAEYGHVQLTFKHREGPCRSELVCNKEQTKPWGEAEVSDVRFPSLLLPFLHCCGRQSCKSEPPWAGSLWSENPHQVGVWSPRRVCVAQPVTAPHTHTLTTCTSGACAFDTAYISLLSTASLCLSSLACQIACWRKRWLSPGFFFFFFF